jgi:hypothetical protein
VVVALEVVAVLEMAVQAAVNGELKMAQVLPEQPILAVARAELANLMLRVPVVQVWSS